MRRFEFILTLTVISVFSTFSQWQVVNVDSSGDRFRDVCVVNQNIIWVTKVVTANNICRTTDGGNTWQVFSGINDEIYYVSAVSENKAWVSTIHGDVFVTNNGGLNWIEQLYQPKEFINFLKFFNENTGFFATDPVNDTVGFFFTRNGGINWIRSQNSPVIPYVLALLENCVNALDTNFIWMCVSPTQNQYIFYRLTDGLSSIWHSYPYNETGTFRNAVFSDHNNGLVTGSGKILFTSNGGVNWSLRNSIPGGFTAFDFCIVPGPNWVVLNSGNSILLSKDFFLTWQANSGFSPLYYSDAKDTNSIWIAYGNGNLLKYNFNSIGIIKLGNEIPKDFHLSQNYPNPFNPSTKIRFALQSASDFSIKVYDMLGREVYSIYDSKQAGEYEFTFNGSTFASGIYFYQIKASSFVDTKKMILLK
jgi:hypothetical protein